MSEQEKNGPEVPPDASTSPTNVNTSSAHVGKTVEEVQESIGHVLPRIARPVLARPSAPPTFSGDTGLKRY